LVFRG